MRIIHLTLGFVSLCYAAGRMSEENCRKGPSFWCENIQNAKVCGVDAFCKAMSKKVKFHLREPLKKRDGSPPVNVTLYYESLCPDCQETWKNQLFPTYQKLASSGILNIILVPYGNANERQSGNKWIFYCQHGPAECDGNLIETCAIHLFPKPSQLIPFLHCMEYYGPNSHNGPFCAGLSKMDYGTISVCVKSDLGNSLQHEMAVKTEKLNPPHKYVPWFTLNGVHTNEIQNNLNTNMLQTVCNAYTGTKPVACSNMKKACYKD